MAGHYSATPIGDRLAARSVAAPGGCWVWTGSLTAGGYGQISYRGERVYTHRLAYELWAGPIPPGMVIDHLCHVRNCLNVAHLSVTTNEANASRSVRKLATHCQRGHEYTPENTLINKTYNSRDCRTCREAYRRSESQREAARQRARRRRAAAKAAKEAA